ncbi:stage III sporulation protein AF [Fictibacillus solisalsi]|uniref:Stage III sporulation protein AF n=1 Tax=Fictibacillus solisalsi TaxID=459525 RepID=A0A1G9W9B3_9BACL|nr:stage III sporulation protein AF [Fictibacillus solisalsi]SDM80595.1 stage III sporulation protein AF [Fictibacillus solisalsi]
MEFLTDWISNIVLIILLSVIVDLLLPNNGFQKYIKMVVGLLLILAILNPLLKAAGSNVDKVFEKIGIDSRVKESEIKNSIDTKKKEIQDSQSAYILEQTRVHMENLVKEELKTRYEVTISDLVLVPKQTAESTSNPDDIQSVQVTLAAAENEKQITVPAVKNVEINSEQPVQEKRAPFQSKPVQAFLAKKWQMKEKNVEIFTEGGEEHGEKRQQ